MSRKGPLAYIQEHMKGFGNFLQEWKALSPEDQETLKRWANEEQDALGL